MAQQQGTIKSRSGQTKALGDTSQEQRTSWDKGRTTSNSLLSLNTRGKVDGGNEEEGWTTTHK